MLLAYKSEQARERLTSCGKEALVGRDAQLVHLLHAMSRLSPGLPSPSAGWYGSRCRSAPPRTGWCDRSLLSPESPSGNPQMMRQLAGPGAAVRALDILRGGLISCFGHVKRVKRRVDIIPETPVNVGACRNHQRIFWLNWRVCLGKTRCETIRGMNQRRLM